jgi:hypothetical protein
MSVEGIFRKNGNIRRLRDLTEAIDRDPLSVDLSQDNPVQLAALLKKFLRDLPDPLMTYKLHRLFVASQCGLNFFRDYFAPAQGTLLFSSTSGRGRTPTTSTFGFSPSTQESSRYDGGFVCLSEVGGVFRTQRRRDRK